MVTKRQPKIYVLHNDPVITRTVADFLEDLSYNAVLVHAAEELEASLDADAPQTAATVVAQLETLGIDPVGRLRKIQARQHNVVFVLMIEDGFPASEVAACGVHALLRQPLRLADLERALIGL